MECFIVEKENIDLDRRELILTGDEAHHALRSLRIQIGEQLLATDLFGTSYRCHRVECAVPGTLVCSIAEVLPNFGEPERDVMLIQGLISQPSRWEFLIEKATELGVSVIQPVTTERTERENFNRERSERILRAAVKQTKRSRKPELRELSSLGTALSVAIKEGCRVVMLHEGVLAGFPSLPSGVEAGFPSLHSEGSTEIAPLHQTFGGGEPIAITVGPEGGFSDHEVLAASKSGAEIASLGPRRLRAETAAIAALAIVIDH